MKRWKIVVLIAVVVLVGVGLYLYFMDWGTVESEVEKTEIENTSKQTESSNGVTMNDLSELNGKYYVSTGNPKKQELLFYADGLKGTTGRFDEFEISFDLTDNWKNGVLTVEVQSVSLFTNNDMRDEHLQSEDFFHVEKYPTIEFRSDQITKGDTSYIASGKLNLLGYEKELEVPFSYLGNDTYEDGDKFAAFEGNFILDQYDYGMAESRSVESEVKINFYVELVERGESSNN